MSKSIGYSKVYRSETDKIRTSVIELIRSAPDIIDIGCGNDKLTQYAYGVDGRKLDGVDLVLSDFNSINRLHLLIDKRFDVVYSSHVLEHMVDPKVSLTSWIELLKPGGILFLYLPCDDKYDNSSNPEHLHRFTVGPFTKWFEQEFGDKMAGIKSFNDYGYDRYSFALYATKKGE